MTPELQLDAMAGFAAPLGWAIGEIWKTPRGHMMQVVEICNDGCAMMQMIKPFKLRAVKQKQIPVTWKLVNNL